MKARVVALVALAAAVTLTSLAAAGPEAAKRQRVTIDMKIYPQNRFVLTAWQFGAVMPDSGTISSNWTKVPGRSVMRDGQQVTIYNGAVTTLTGKLGTLTIRDRNEWVDVGNGDGIGIGTWKVVRGTGQYAGMVGKGRNAHAGLGNPWYARYEGFLTAP